MSNNFFNKQKEIQIYPNHYLNQLLYPKDNEQDEHIFKMFLSNENIST